MKKILFIFITIFTVHSIFAQENYSSQIGIKLQNFQYYGIGRYGITQPVINFIYKKQVSDKKYRRIDFGFTAVRNIWNSSLRIGNENHIHLNKKFDLTYGLALETQYSNVGLRDGKRKQTFDLGAGFLLGLEYEINKRWTVGISFTPIIMKQIHNINGYWSKFSKSNYYLTPNLAISFIYTF